MLISLVDIIIVDMNLQKEFKADDIQSKCKWSPYLGRSLKGWPVSTIVRGNIVATQGRLVGKQGFGKLVSRKK